jgi:O-antigen/teichoic acid export membrane protein
MENTSKFNLSIINKILTIVWRVLGLVLVFPLALILTNETLVLLLVVFLQYIVVYRVVLMGVPSGFKELGNRAFYAQDYKAEMKLFILSTTFTVLLSIGGFFIIRYSHLVINYEFIIDDFIRINKLLSITLIVSGVLSVLKAYLKPRIEEFYILGNVVYRGIVILSVVLAIILSISLSAGDLVFVMAVGLLVASVITLIYFAYYFYRTLTDIKYSYNYENQDTKVSVLQLIKYLFKNSLPYVMMLAIIPLYRLFDIYILQSVITPQLDAVIATVRYQFNVYYLIALFAVVLTLFGNVFHKRVAKDFEINNLSGVDKNINKAIQSVLYFGLPLMAYFIVFSDQVYGVIFSQTSVLRFAAPYVVLIPLLLVTSNLVNMINKASYLWYSLLFGILLKAITTYAITIYLGINGAVIATHIGLLASIVMNIMVLKSVTLFDTKYLLKRTGYLLLITVLTTGVLIFVDQLLVNTLDYQLSTLNNLLYILITFAIAVVLYFVMSLYTGLFQIISELGMKWKDLYDQIEEWEDDELLW